MSRDCEYAGDAGDEAGKRVRVAGAAGRVEFSDRQCSHSLISGRRRERLGDLVEGRSGVAAVGVLRQRGIDEVQDVDVEVEGERPCRKLAERGQWPVAEANAIIVGARGERILSKARRPI